MTFWEYIKQAFNGFGWSDVLELVIIASVVLFVFLYSARHNSLFYTYVLAAMGLIVFAVTFADLGSFNVILLLLLLILYTFGTILLFNAELKRDVFKRSWKSLLHTFSMSGEGYDLSEEEVDANIANIVKACQNMSKADVGALIVVVRESISDSVLESGTMINAVISSELLETIFFPKSPQHIQHESTLARRRGYRQGQQNHCRGLLSASESGADACKRAWYAAQGGARHNGA